MTNPAQSRVSGASQDGLAVRAEQVILHKPRSASAPVLNLDPGARLKASVDLGTAYLVLTVLDEAGWPLAGEWQFAQVARDGLVVDFIGAIDLLREMKTRVEKRLGRPIEHAASGYPPGVPAAEVRATAHVVEAAGIDCSGLISEPEAANRVLGIQDGVLQDGKVIYSADEATGGTHFSLVIAGALDMPFEDAERLKTDPAEQARLFPLVRPVMEKVGTIIRRHIKGYSVPSITLVGGGAALPGMAGVIQEVVGIPAYVPKKPLFVTPVGLALSDQEGNHHG
jgi:ethanolamine utilization protein EutJ